MDKKINQERTGTDADFNNLTTLVQLGSGATGELFTATIGQLKKFIAVKKIFYKANGTEGTSLTIPQINGASIMSLHREGLLLYETSLTPDSGQFRFDLTNLTFGAALSLNERLLIIYSNA
jgi:hypothetical protein